MSEFNEPWVGDPGYEVNVMDAAGAEVAFFSDHNSPAQAHFASARRAVACVNFLAGVPTDTIVACTRVEGQRQNEAAAMFLAFLRGDGLVALAYADEVQDQAQLKAGEKFVRRDELVRANGTLAAAVGRLRKELRRIEAELKPPGQLLPAEYVIQGEALRNLIDRIQKLLADTKKCDPA